VSGVRRAQRASPGPSRHPDGFFRHRPVLFIGAVGCEPRSFTRSAPVSVGGPDFGAAEGGTGDATD
jgi:hypothetical protein